MQLQSRATVFIAIGAMFALMGGFVLYASFDNPELEKAEIRLDSVEVFDVDEVQGKTVLDVVFLVKNPSEKTFTVPSIAYELYANGIHLGSGQYSTEDIAMPGRAAFYGGAEIPLKSRFFMTLDDQNARGYDLVVSGSPVTYSADGTIVVETAWSLVEKDFST